MEVLQSVAVVAAAAGAVAMTVAKHAGVVEVGAVAGFGAAVAMVAVKEGEELYDFFVSKAVVEVPLMAAARVHQNQFVAAAAAAATAAVAAVAAEARQHHLQSSRCLRCCRFSRHSPSHPKSAASTA